MNELMNIESRNTLTSLEVAQIVGKEHKNIFILLNFNKFY